MIEEVKQELLNLKDEKYKKFSSSLLPDTDNIIGIRLPILRRISKRIANSCYERFFNENDDEFFELTMLEGMIIGNLNLEFDEIKKYIEKFILKINNWSVCDSFCCSLKIVKKNKKKVKIFLEKYFKSNKEFELRFAYVIMLSYFFDDYNYMIEKIACFNNEKYYSKMAAAWALSIVFMKHFDNIFNDIKNLKIHPWVLNKGIQKALESYRLNKEKLRQMKAFLN